MSEATNAEISVNDLDFLIRDLKSRFSLSLTSGISKAYKKKKKRDSNSSAAFFLSTACLSSLF